VLRGSDCAGLVL